MLLEPGLALFPMYEPAKLADMLEPWPGLWKACSAPGGRLNPRPSCSVTIKIPGLTGPAGGEINASEAAIFCASEALLDGARVDCDNGVEVPGVVGPDDDLTGASGVMVDCEEEREKVLARGARCVSFNSVQHQVSYCSWYLRSLAGIATARQCRMIGAYSW